MMNQWDHSGTIYSGWIRLHVQFFKKPYILIKIYFQSSLLPSSNEVCFTAGTSHWTTGSSVKSVYVSQNTCSLYITIIDATLFCGHFNGSRFTYSNAILLINTLCVCGTLP